MRVQQRIQYARLSSLLQQQQLSSTWCKKGWNISINYYSMLVIVLLLLTGSSCVDYVLGLVRAENRAIQILNSSGRKIEIYWISPDDGEAVLMSDPVVLPGAEFPLESYVGHQFEAREVPNRRTGSCGSSSDDDNDTTVVPGVCRRALFQVSESDGQLTNITTTFDAVFVDNKIKAKQSATGVVDMCHSTAKDRLLDAGTDQGAVAKIIDDLMKCVQGSVSTVLEDLNEEIAFQAEVRKNIASSLENYTCIDDTLNSTKDITSEIWSNTRDGVDYVVHIKHDRPASKIYVIENFIRDDECIAMEENAKPTLHRAVVADGKGGSQLSLNRKAMQAGIKVQWDDEINDNPIARVSRRVYDYANHVLGLNISENGQEDLMSIQYFGRGKDDPEPDQYTPHCDGDCNGLPHTFGQRMATMVMYCTVPESGGHTNFRNAGVHVKPERHSAIFFSYIDPRTKMMDTGFTEHSGCPVFDGEKKIVTQWIRYGVDDDNPWDSFNTLGIKLSDLAEFEDDADLVDDVEFVTDDADPSNVDDVDVNDLIDDDDEDDAPVLSPDAIRQIEDEMIDKNFNGDFKTDEDDD